MEKWRSFFRVDVVPRLLACNDLALRVMTKRDLLGEEADLRAVQGSKPAVSLLRKQSADGRWIYKSPRTVVPGLDNNDQVETYRSLELLIELFGFDSGHEAVRRAAEFVLAHQTEEGDLRGVYGHQHTPNYTAGFLELLIKAGMERDARVRRGMDWLLAARQQDGGWAIPIRTRGVNLDAASMFSSPILPDLARLSSHMVTGVVLRAFAAHPGYRGRTEALEAAKMLKSKLFKKDAYPDRDGIEYWERGSFPFWFTDIVSALDTLTLLGFGMGDIEVKRALRWLRDRQAPDGTFGLGMLRGTILDAEGWQELVIARSARRALRPRGGEHEEVQSTLTG